MSYHLTWHCNANNVVNAFKQFGKLETVAHVSLAKYLSESFWSLFSFIRKKYSELKGMFRKSLHAFLMQANPSSYLPAQI